MTFVIQESNSKITGHIVGEFSFVGWRFLDATLCFLQNLIKSQKHFFRKFSLDFLRYDEESLNFKINIVVLNNLSYY